MVSLQAPPWYLSLRYLHFNRSAVRVLHTKHFLCTDIYHYPNCTYIIFGLGDKGKLLDMTGVIYEKRKLWVEMEIEKDNNLFLPIRLLGKP